MLSVNVTGPFVNVTSSVVNVSLTPSTTLSVNLSTLSSNNSRYEPFSVYSQVIAGLCAVLASCITFHQIYCHLKNYTCCKEQRYIIRILVIIPAYALYSFLSIILAVHAKMTSVYIEPIHDVAEALTIYSFLALCYEYLRGEGCIMLELNGKTINSSLFYGTCCFAGKPYTILFLRFCKVATLQYTLMKPLTSALSIFLLTAGKYKIGDFSPNSGYLYLFLINNFTVTLALYGLLLFYFATRDQLRPFSPVLKFVTIKAIIFFSFWQDVLFSILEWSHVVQGNSEYSADLIATRSKNLLISIELVFTAIALRYAFPYSIYVLHRPPRLVLDLQLDGQEWPGSGKFESPPVNGKPHKSAHSTGKDSQSVRTDLLYGTSLFTDRPIKGEREPLPWDIADPAILDDDSEQTVWDSQNPTTLPSISASIKATIDPRDILVDAIHNFHPNYRHYTQTRMDENT